MFEGKFWILKQKEKERHVWENGIDAECLPRKNIIIVKILIITRKNIFLTLWEIRVLFLPI